MRAKQPHGLRRVNREVRLSSPGNGAIDRIEFRCRAADATISAMTMNQSAAVRLAGIFGFLAVALGAFGAHGLEDTLEANGRVDVWETAVLYHLVHAVALLSLAISGASRRFTAIAFAVGVVVFSGSLYTLALTNIGWFGAITPIGGLCFLAGWGALIFKPIASAPATGSGDPAA
jgi:uncharacterized membrane protein YgdD (TMEM256/DUF423 family)